MSDSDPLEIDPNNPAGTAVGAGLVDPPAPDISPITVMSWDAALGTWIRDHVRNSPISGATEAWNHLMGVLPHLRDRLNAELGKKE